VSAEPVVLTTSAMGTSFELVLVGDSRDRRRTLAVGEAAIEVIREVEARWSLFLPASRLAQLNRVGHLVEIDLDGDDCELFEVATAVRKASEGAFDLNVARAMEEAGHFGQRGLIACLGGETGGANETWHFDPDAQMISFTGAGPALDLGGIAKGHAIDLAARELQESGISSALLHGGTSAVIAFGSPPDQEVWMVSSGGFEIPLDGLALATSCAGSQSNTGASHILIPGDAQHAVPPKNTATVLAPSAALGDAWATALCVRPELSQSAAPELLRQGVTVLSPQKPTHHV